MQLESAAQADGRTLGEWCREAILRGGSASDAVRHDPDLIPSFGTKGEYDFCERKGKVYVEEPAHGSANDRSAEVTGSGCWRWVCRNESG